MQSVIYNQLLISMLTVTFPGRFESLEKISDFVAKAAKTAGLDDAGVYAVQLAVDEACTNIIEHAYKGEDKGNIHCSCETIDDGIKVVLRDNGCSFDPEQVPEPVINVPLKDLKPRGLGMFLMHKMMDEVHFEFTSNSGNILTMVKHKSH